MSHLIVPARVSADAASVWIGSIDEAARPTLFANGQAVPAPAWQQIGGGPHTLNYGRVEIRGLASRARCNLQLRLGARVVAEGNVTTLPRSLPAPSEAPFTIMLGSCFDVAHDRGVGRATVTPKPDIKILCGDQVYLDAPAAVFAVPHTRGQLEKMFFETYQRTWERSDGGPGFRRLLEEGANYFSSDDHEYWNNAPNATPYATNTWTAGGRQTWWQLASNLYGAFQNDRVIEQFSVGEVSFFLADTRIHRDADRRQLMRPAEWEALNSWVRNLAGPGVLVVGQPVFAGKGNFWSRFSDWNFPDFEQYAALARTLGAARHSIVILTGDVHYGRVATCQLRAPGPGAPPPRLIEVISSPLALVAGVAGGKWDKAPDQFPAFAIDGVARFPVQTVASFQMKEDHFLTVELSGVRGGARIAVRSWPVITDPARPPGQKIFEDTLY